MLRSDFIRSLFLAAVPILALAAFTPSGAPGGSDAQGRAATVPSSQTATSPEASPQQSQSGRAPSDVIGKKEVATEPNRSNALLLLHPRRRIETKEGSGRYHLLTKSVEWDPKKTALVICDMGDKHWCAESTRRVGEMAPRMNALVAAARAKGVLIIHCPSDTLDFYEGTPQRKLAQSAPAVATQRPLERWCHLEPGKEGKLPIDDSDGGCDDLPQPKNYKAWSRQIATIEVKDGDAITDSAEAYYLMKQRGIENLLVMGVHTNMCVLGRPFSIRQMVYQGMNVILVRDMTDTMYNPAKSPFVHHCTGTDLVIEHIEKHWCPTITSVDLLGGREFRFSEDQRPHVVFVVAEDEYKTEVSLPEFAARHLGKEFRTTFVFGSETERFNIPGLDVLEQADVMVVSVRRRPLPAAQLDLVRRFVASGKPVVGIRTASHAFAPRVGMPLEAGLSEWPTFDPDVLGGHYVGHREEGPQTQLAVATGGAGHPIFEGVDLAQLVGYGSLYQTSPLGSTAKPLLIGRVANHPEEPAAWTNTTGAGGKVFYTSLGHLDDFKQPAFNRLMLNAIRWAAAK
ncbi:MAG: ThuA domain-containing protein [Planctomycetales bacterium]